MNMSDPIGPADDEDLPDDIHRFCDDLDARIARHIAGGPERLMTAARDAVLSPGKRMRPFMLYLVARGGVGGTAPREAVLDAGVAVEMVHAASLVLDDLPCMDDAGLRRGRPTCHVVHGEATAILTAIGLLNGAYGVLAGIRGVNPAQRLRLIATLTQAVGWGGLVAGQELDLNGFGEGDARGVTAMERSAEVNRLKTGQLLVAAMEMGAILAALPPDRATLLRRFATDLGQAFQIADDLSDAFGRQEEIGKDVGQDAGKPTLLADLGPDLARHRCRDLLLSADRALVASGVDPAPFRRLIGRLFDHDLLSTRGDRARAAFG